MPKYYRFRATTPTRTKRYRDMDKDGGVQRIKFVAEKSLLDVSLACTPALSWYMRRTSWRKCPHLIGLPRELSAGFLNSIHLGDRSGFVYKIPTSLI